MSTYEISKSSLLSLKAEILRKHDELSKTKVENEAKVRNLKKQSPLEIKNKGLENRQKNDIVEDENLLKKSRAALEAKSKLYEKLSKSNTNLTDEEIEYNRRYLVRFDKKQKKSKLPDLPPEDSDDDIDRYRDEDEINMRGYDEPPKDPDEEWVEYVDCLGRTRTCLRKDLDYLKSKDQDLKQIVDEKRKNRGEDVQSSKIPTQSQTSDEKQKSEITEENELLSFDMRRQILREQWEKEEEKLRDKDDIHYQDILFDEARTHGVSYYAFSKDEKERARQQEALNKLREETERQQKRAQELKEIREKQLAARIKAAKNRKRARMGLPPEEDEPEPTATIPSNDETKKDSDVDDEEEKKRIKKIRKKHIRPWDIGKDGVKKEHYEYSQEEWVDKKRRERPTEFAPPTAYKKDDKKPTSNLDRHSREKRRRKSKERIVVLDNKRMESVPIINECSDDNDEDNERTKPRGSGVEIPPPVSFDYYCDSSKKPKSVKKSTNVGDSIEAGLKYLREQIEKKKSSNCNLTDENIFID